MKGLELQAKEMDSRFYHPKLKAEKCYNRVTLATWRPARARQQARERWLGQREAAHEGCTVGPPVAAGEDVSEPHPLCGVFSGLGPVLEVLPHPLPQRPVQRSWPACSVTPDPDRLLHNAPSASELRSEYPQVLVGLPSAGFTHRPTFLFYVQAKGHLQSPPNGKQISKSLDSNKNYISVNFLKLRNSS